MTLALAEAANAAVRGEVPVGAVCLGPDGALLAKAHNSPIGSQDPTAHAEILCLRNAAVVSGNYRLPGCILAVTLEPCIMCLGAMVHARIAGLVYAARDPKSGALNSRLRGLQLSFLNHRFWVLQGNLEAEAGAMLSGFFRSRRRQEPTGPIDPTPGRFS